MLRIASLTLVAAVAVVVDAVWIARDLPRARVEHALAAALGAEVRLGRFAILDVDRFRLEDVTVRRMVSQPLLDRLDVRRLDVAGRPMRIAAGHFAALAFHDARAVLAPPTMPPAAEVSEPGELTVGRLSIESGRVEVAAAGETLRFDVDSEWTGIGVAPEGVARLRGDRLVVAPLGALLAAAGTRAGGPETAAGARQLPGLSEEIDIEAEDVAVDVRVTDAAAHARVAIRAGRATARLGGRALELPGPSVELVARVEPGTTAVDVDATAGLAPHVGALTASGRLDTETTRLLRFEADVADVELRTWLAWSGVLPEGVAVEGRAGLRARSEDGSAVTWTLGAGLTRVAWTDAPEARDVAVAAEGMLDLDHPELGGPLVLRLDAGRVDGEIAGRTIPAGLTTVSLAFEGTAAGGDSPALQGRAELRTSGAGSGIASGRVGLDDAGAVVPSLQWSWSGPELPALTALAAALDVRAPEGVRLRGRPVARGAVRGRWPDSEVRAELSVDALEIDGAGPAGAWTGRCPRLTVGAHRQAGDDDVRVEVSECAAEVTVEALEAVTVRVSAEATVSPGSSRLTLGRVAADAGPLGRVALEVPEAALGEPVEGTVGVENVDLERWQGLLLPWLGDPLRAHSIHGQASAHLFVRVDDAGAWAAEGDASIAGSGFASDDGARVAEGLETSWGLRVQGEADGSVRASARGRAGGFQLLWGSFYADYSDLAADLDLSGILEAREASSAGGSAPGWSAAGAVTLPEGPRVRVEAGAAPGRPTTWSADVDVEDLATTFERYLRRPFEGSVAALERIQAGGAVRARLDGTLSDNAWTARGDLSMAGVRLEGVEGQVEVADLTLDLPVDVAVARTGDARLEISGEERRGHLEFSHLRFGEVAFDRTSTGLVVRGDSVRLEEGLAVPFLGGVLGLEELSVRDALRPSWHLQTAILLHRVRLEALSEAMGLFPLEGELEGYFPDVRLTDRTFRMEGEGSFSLFGGELTVRDISGEDLLSRYPQLMFSAEFRDIDLLQVTRTFDVGEMSGVLQGYLRDCELFRGVPVRFDGRLETVRRKGVPRTINVKAINNISLLGTGSKVGVLDRGIQKLFDRYTYDRLGIDLQLDDDRFRLTGLERRGNRELFLKGRLPFRIDVVNAKPGQTVSFKVMMERAGNLEFSMGAP